MNLPQTSPPARRRGAGGFTLVEVLLSTGISMVVFAGFYSAVISMHRYLAAADDYAKAKADQMRLTDYLALDLRRALTVTAGGTGSTIVTLTMPDFYDSTGKPRTPTITNRVINYGSPTMPVTVTYTKTGSSIFRQENSGTPLEIATNVEDFKVTLQDLSKVLKTQISFIPRFRFSAGEESRTSTTIYNTTLLRNKRRDGL